MQHCILSTQGAVGFCTKVLTAALARINAPPTSLPRAVPSSTACAVGTRRLIACLAAWIANPIHLHFQASILHTKRPFQFCTHTNSPASSSALPHPGSTSGISPVCLAGQPVQNSSNQLSPCGQIPRRDSRRPGEAVTAAMDGPLVAVAAAVASRGCFMTLTANY